MEAKKSMLEHGQWLETQCPRCSGCGQRHTMGKIINLPYCLECAGVIERKANEDYEKLPRNERGKVIARKGQTVGIINGEFK